MLRTWREDSRSVARGLFRSRSFAIAAVLILAAGAAASLLVFTLVRSVLLRPLPVRDQHELIVGWRDLPASGYAHHPFGDRAIARAAADTEHFTAIAGVDANGVGRVVLQERRRRSRQRRAGHRHVLRGARRRAGDRSTSRLR